MHGGLAALRSAGLQACQCCAARACEHTLTAVPGIKVGHVTLTERPTGCTVILVDGDAVGGVSQRGGAPGTRETDLLNPLNMVDKVNAVVLAGGSAFGLEAATGTVRWLEEHNIGWPAGRGARADRPRCDPVRPRRRRQREDPPDRRLRLQGGRGGVDRAGRGRQRRRRRRRDRRQVRRRGPLDEVGPRQRVDHAAQRPRSSPPSSPSTRSATSSIRPPEGSSPACAIPTAPSPTRARSCAPAAPRSRRAPARTPPSALVATNADAVESAGHAHGDDGRRWVCAGDQPVAHQRRRRHHLLARHRPLERHGRHHDRSARSPPKRWPTPSSAPGRRPPASPAFRPPGISRGNGGPRVRPLMNLQLAFLLVYSALLIGIGLLIGRRVRGTSDFFVAGRSLGPGLIFSTMLAANIGAGSTVSATGARLYAAASPRGGGSDRPRSASRSWRSGSGPRSGGWRRRATCGRSATTSSSATAPTVRALIAAAAVGRLAVHPRRTAVRDGRDPRDRRRRAVLAGMRDRRRW